MTGKPIYLSALVNDEPKDTNTAENTATPAAATTVTAPTRPAHHPRTGTGAPHRSAGGFGGKRRGSPRDAHRRRPKMINQTMIRHDNDTIPPIEEGVVRVIPLGGVEEIGKNMIAVEYGEDIIIIDMGFQFKEESTPGIDYILPNAKYVEDRKSKVKAVIITHGHLDHTGAIPYLMDRVGNPPLYSRFLTTIMIKKRLEEFPHIPQFDIRVVEKEETIKVGALKVKFFSVTHTIPDSMGIIVETPFGAIVDPGDPKLEHTDGIVSEREENEYKKFEKENVLMLLNDSTNIENPGFSTPEKLVHKNLEEIIRTIKGRLIIGTFASQMERLIKIIEVAESFGKKIILEGRSMKNNIEIAKLAGMLTVKKDTIIPVEEIESYAADRIVVLATGAQGEEFAALMRISTKNHRNIKLRKGDTVLLSSSIIPGNEKTVEKLKDNLARQGAKIIHYRTSDVYIHSTGHGNKSELEWMYKKIKPRFFMPIHGNHYRLKLHAETIENLGLPRENIVVPDNGTIVELYDKGEKMRVLKEKAPSGMVAVDGFAIGGIQEVVIRDRQLLSEDGMFVIIATVDSKTGKLKKSPDIISRGFVYLRESQELLRHARIVIKKTAEDSSKGMNPINFDFVKQNVTEEVSKFLFQKTNKRPIVIPVLLGV